MNRLIFAIFLFPLALAAQYPLPGNNSGGGGSSGPVSTSQLTDLQAVINGATVTFAGNCGTGAPCNVALGNGSSTQLTPVTINASGAATGTTAYIGQDASGNPTAWYNAASGLTGTNITLVPSTASFPSTPHMEWARCTITASAGRWDPAGCTMLAAAYKISATIVSTGGITVAYVGNTVQLSSTGIGTVTTVSAPPQFSVANPTSAPAITYPALPNSYTEDPNSPYLQNTAIRRYSALFGSGTSGTYNAWNTEFESTGTVSYVAATAGAPGMSGITSVNASVTDFYGNNLDLRTGRANGMQVTCAGAYSTTPGTSNVRWIPCMVAVNAATMLAADVETENSADIIYSSTGTYSNVTDTTHFMLCTGNGSAQNCTSTGVAADTAFHRFFLFEDITNSRWTGCVDTTCVSSGTDNPASGTNLTMAAGSYGINSSVTGQLQMAFVTSVSDW